MNRSLAFVTIAAALGLTACTSTPTPDNTAMLTSSTSSSTTQPPAQVVTELVTATVTNPPAPPVEPVIDSFGYGKLKLGMTKQQALDAGLIGPAVGGQPADACTLHGITGTSQRTWVSSANGVATISFTPDMTSDGVGIGATEEKLKAEYTNLVPAGPNYQYTAEADGNSAARFTFGVAEDTKVLWAAFLSLKTQDCHN